jgi:hypothetical protein
MIIFRDTQKNPCTNTGSLIDFSQVGSSDQHPNGADIMSATATKISITLEETIKTIRTELKRRTGKTWSVTRGSGTAYGWLRITAPPARQTGEFEYMTEEDIKTLGEAMGFDRPISRQGLSVPASTEHYREYVNRAKGLPFEVAQAYWD